jgi:hypothetical protein
MGATTIVYTTPIRRISRHLVSRSGTLTFTGTHTAAGDDFAPVVGKEILSINIEPKAGFIHEYSAGKALSYHSDYDAVADGALIAVPDSGTVATGAVRWSALGKK